VAPANAGLKLPALTLSEESEVSLLNAAGAWTLPPEHAMEESKSTARRRFMFDAAPWQKLA
jgi:hypothetical protein